MLKKTLFATALIALLTLSLAAQTARPTLNAKALGGNVSRNGNPATVPSYCNPCLFYSGDWDPNTSWVAYANWNTTALQQATVYVPFVVPAGKTWKINGLFTNGLALNTSSIDPMRADWSINSGVSEGNGGTVIASGNAPATFNATGRNFQNTYFEFTTQVAVKPNVTLQAGTYWLSVVPNCTNANDATCNSAAYYINDSITGANRGGPRQPGNMNFTTSNFLGFDSINLCDPQEGYPPPACSHMSAGVLGKRQ